LVSRILVSGLDPESGLEQEEDSQQSRWSGGRNSLGRSREGGLALAALEPSLESSNPLERSYRPKMLQVLPPVAAENVERQSDSADKEDEWDNFNPDALCRLILPQGLKFCTDKEVDSYPPR